MQVHRTDNGKCRRGENRANQSRRRHLQLFGDHRTYPGNGNHEQPGESHIVPHRRQQPLRNDRSAQKMDYQKRYGNDYAEEPDGLLHDYHIGIRPRIFIRHQHHLVQSSGQHAHNAAQQIGKGVFIGEPGHQQRYADCYKGCPKNARNML